MEPCGSCCVLCGVRKNHNHISFPLNNVSSTVRSNLSAVSSQGKKKFHESTNACNGRKEAVEAAALVEYRPDRISDIILACLCQYA